MARIWAVIIILAAIGLIVWAVKRTKGPNDEHGMDEFDNTP